MKNKTVWYYYGDINLEYGGIFYTDRQFDYFDAVRVTPCSDAGCQDNVFWIESGSIVVPKPEKVEEALRSCGITTHQDVNDHELACALASYGYFETDTTETIQIGPDDPYHRGETVRPTTKVRAGTDLEKWVRRHYIL